MTKITIIKEQQLPNYLIKDYTETIMSKNFKQIIEQRIKEYEKLHEKYLNRVQDLDTGENRDCIQIHAKICELKKVLEMFE